MELELPLWYLSFSFLEHASVHHFQGERKKHGKKPEKQHHGGDLWGLGPQVFDTWPTTRTSIICNPWPCHQRLGFSYLRVDMSPVVSKKIVEFCFTRVGFLNVFFDWNEWFSKKDHNHDMSFLQVEWERLQSTFWLKSMGRFPTLAGPRGHDQNRGPLEK